jgi:hypothetical protein
MVKMPVVDIVSEADLKSDVKSTPASKEQMLPKQLLEIGGNKMYVWDNDNTKQ